MLTSVVLVVLLLTSPFTIGALVLWSAHRGHQAALAAASPATAIEATPVLAEAA